MSLSSAEREALRILAVALSDARRVLAGSDSPFLAKVERGCVVVSRALAGSQALVIRR